MIQLLIGAKGSGKTKNLIELVNTAAHTSMGAVVCVEKGDKLKLDITYKARLVDTDQFGIDSAEALYGFLAGILASNSDITDIFVDSSLKICRNDLAAFDVMLEKLDRILGEARLIMTASVPVEDATPTILKYVQNA